MAEEMTKIEMIKHIMPEKIT